MATLVQQSAITERPRVPWPAVTLIAVLLLAMGLRLALVFAHPTLDWPDEVFQTTEPAHRLAFGNGVVTWEWRDSTRNWIFPAFLAFIMRLTVWMGQGSSGYVRSIAVVLSTLSLAVVWVGYRWGSRVLGGFRAGLIVAMVCAVWYDVVYYGPRTLNEVVAAHLLVLGLYLAYWADPQLRERVRLSGAGLLLGAVVGLRIQIAPAVLVALVILGLRLGRRQWLLILLGAAVAFLVFGFVDAFTAGYPFSSYVQYVRINLQEGKSASFGALPWRWYGFALVLHVGWLLPFSMIGARRSPFLAVVAATVILTHNVLGHKEYRFVYPAVVLLIVLGGFGVAEVVRQLESRTQPSVRALAVVAVLLLALAISSWKDAQSRAQYPGILPVFQSLSRDTTVCGVGLRGNWGWSGGYTYLHRDIPIFRVNSEEETARSAAFNVLVTTDRVSAHPATFTLDRCWEESCIYRRSGGCIPDPEHEINAYLSVTGQ